MERCYAGWKRFSDLNEKQLKDRNIVIGDGAKVSPFANASSNLRIGAKTIIEDSVYLHDGVAIGDNVFVNYSVSIAGKVKIGNNVHIGHGVSIGRLSTIGDNCIVEPRATIGYRINVPASTTIKNKNKPKQ